MKLDIAIMACNENRMYLDFWPLVHHAWTKLNVVPKMIFVGYEIPIDVPFRDDIILFEPLENVSTIWTAQVIRIFYPALMQTQNGVIISDMDIVPMNYDYFHKSIESVTTDTFFCYRDVLRHENMLPICYNVASPKVWSSVSIVRNIQDIRNRLSELHKITGDHWCTDQYELLKYVERAQKEGLKFIGKSDETRPCFSRLDRIDPIVKDFKIPDSNNIYCDFHMLRPQSEFSEQNQKLFDTFFKQDAIPTTTENIVPHTIQKNLDSSMEIPRTPFYGLSPSDWQIYIVLIILLTLAFALFVASHIVANKNRKIISQKKDKE